MLQTDGNLKKMENSTTVSQRLNGIEEYYFSKLEYLELSVMTYFPH